MRILSVIIGKEMLDILRDCRAILTITLISVMAGPMILLMLSQMVSSFETRAERRIVVVDGIAFAPSLQRHFKNETATILKAPKDYQTKLMHGQLADPVLVIPPDFEQRWQEGQPITLTIVSSANNAKANAGINRLRRWVSNFSQERATILLASRTLAPAFTDAIEIEEIDLADPRAETSKIFGMLPYFFVLAALYGVWGAAIEVTIGERELKTLDPLMIASPNIYTLVLAKWIAVSLVGTAILTMAIVGFIPAQWLMQSENLKAMFSFGANEAWLSWMVCLPLVWLLAATLMWAASIANSTRQAQTYATMVMFTTAFLPMLFSMDGDTSNPITQWIPVIAQHRAIISMLEGQATGSATMIYLWSLHGLLTACALVQSKNRFYKKS